MKSIAPDDRVLITGGSGSIGRALCAALLPIGCRIRIFARDEAKQLTLSRKHPQIEYVLGDVRDSTAVLNAVRNSTVVIHAASLKFVDRGEVEPAEYVKTNILGTINVIAAVQHEGQVVRRCVGISSDKCAGWISNNYGLTKAILEKLFLEASRNANGLKTVFTIARYGNVAGSRSSVIPRWAELRAKGEPISITDPEMTRFLFPISEAVETLDRALLAEQGTIVSRMMKSTDLKTLASIMAGDSETHTIGKRPGERWHETLLTIEEMHASKWDGEFFLLRSHDGTPNKDLDVKRDSGANVAYTSENAPRLAEYEIRMLLHGWINGPTSEGEVSETTRIVLRDAWREAAA